MVYVTAKPRTTEDGGRVSPCGVSDDAAVDFDDGGHLDGIDAIVDAEHFNARLGRRVRAYRASLGRRTVISTGR